MIPADIIKYALLETRQTNSQDVIEVIVLDKDTM